MKKVQLLLYIFITFFFFFCCEEVPPEINPVMGDQCGSGTAPVDDQPRQVLIEEFTGVTCVNCPAGSAAIEELIDEHGDQLIAISIHAGSFSDPYPESEEDFRTPEGSSILDFLGAPLGYPTAVVDRKIFEGEFDLQLFRSQWAGFIAEQLTEEPKVHIAIARDYDETSRELCVTVGIYVQETVEASDVRVSVMILEDDVVDVQLTPDGKDYEYKHKHVLRDMMTAFDGNLLSESLTQGAVIERDFNTILPEDYVAENCSIVAFVNLGGETKEVLQANKVKVVE